MDKRIIGWLRNKNLIDSGSRRNYMAQNIVEQFILREEETRCIKTVFGNGDVVESNKIVNLDIYLNNRKCRIEFYVSSGIPVQLLKGNKFLGDNKAILDYRERCLRIENEKLNFEGYLKDSEEVLDEIMIDNVCDYMGSEKLINFLTFTKTRMFK